MPTSPNNNEETFEWLRRAKAQNKKYPSLCLKLAREARRIPSMYPSALTAAKATPMSERVQRQDNWRRGMVAFFDAPSDSNPYGHIATLSDRKGGVWYCYSNVSGGLVRVVPITLFTESWGDPVQFAATWLNGYDLDLPDKKPSKKPPRPKSHVLQELQQDLKRAKDNNNDKRAKVLQRDINWLKKQ